MPWSSDGLPLLEIDAAHWTVRAAALVLFADEPGAERRLRDAIRQAGLRPVGKARAVTSQIRPGRCSPVYLAADILRVNEAMEG